jgi:3-oxoacyl-[acyl-carrier protein] reductase
MNSVIRVVLITGSRKGIGRYLAEHFLNLGDTVIGCSRSETNLKHSNYTHFCLDVSDEKAVKKMTSSVRKLIGHVDILINNAGMASMNHYLLTPKSTVEKLFNTNVIGTFLFSRELAKLMSKKKEGRIINFSTVAVPLNLEGEAVYAASKSAVVSLTKILAKEVGSLGITVNAIGPTPVLTDLIKAVPKNKIQELLNQQAIGRLGTFEDVLNVIEFFIKPESSFITGQVVYLGGVS